MTEDESARKARAKRLREQIEGLKSEPKPTEPRPSRPRPPSPREFIQRRMRELDQDKKGE